jgi:cytochrome c553
MKNAIRSHAAGACVLYASLAIILAFVGAFLFPLSATADEPEEGHAHERTNVWAIARGGQLYDNWAKVLARVPPKETHPSYPSGSKKKGGSTWRCKECHGWDYKGAVGAYSKGSHYTGIRGLRSMVGADPKAVHKILMDDKHRYTEDQMSHQSMEQLALFVSLGQIDMDLYVDRATKKARGDAMRGAATYQTICAVCHGFDGKAINFKKPENPEYVGTVAHKNPWEFLHKARFGQPGVPMISLIVMPDEALADLLAYGQTLPEK